jgi:two-component system, OmpR family, phosphate regulon sensor histidine kinase PhoR
MKQSKNILTVGLMVSSVLLLLVLQFFWLRTTYEKAYSDFRRETSMLFRTTVFSIRDSMFVKNIEPMWEDSSMFIKGASQPLPSEAEWKDAARVKMTPGDTVIDQVSVDGHSKIRVMISSSMPGDSGIEMLKPFASAFYKMRGQPGQQRNFVIRLGPDSLNTDTLSTRFAKALGESGIDLTFEIGHDETPMILGPERRLMRGKFNPPLEAERLNVFGDSMLTERVSLNPTHGYTASFNGMHTEILKEIAPQIAFSAFLTFIIVASFVIMHRNIRAQQRLMELKNDFISNVTHELKTPVATVSVALEALKDFNALENPERTKEYLNIAQNELNRLTLMTDKILKASAFENQGVSFTPQRVDIHSIIQQIISSMKLVFDKKKLVVNFNAEGTDFAIMGSEVHLTNVVYNLVDNALKYSSDNSTIDIRLKNTTDNIELTVCDYGIGIPKEFHKKIFEKFFRVPTGDVHNVKGYGLGLNYVASVIKSHNGNITLDSEPGNGSSFIIRLPRQNG